MRLTVKNESVRRDIPLMDYLRMDCVSSSDLKAMERSPAYCRAQHQGVSQSTPAQQVGTATHLAVLEPDLYTQRIGVLPEDFNGRTKAGKELRAQMESSYEAVLKWDEDAAVKAMAKAVWANPAAATLLDGPGVIEGTVTVQDPETGLMCKSRPDRWSFDLRTIIDLKKTVRRGARDFLRQAYDLKYFRQLSFYRAQARWLCAKGIIAQEPPDLAALLAVTDEAPYENTVIPIPKSLLDAEEARWRPLLERYADCVNTDTWPGWEAITPADLAGFIKKDYDL